MTKSKNHRAFVRDVDGRIYEIVADDRVAVLADIEQYISELTGNRSGRFFCVADMIDELRVARRMEIV